MPTVPSSRLFAALILAGIILPATRAPAPLYEAPDLTSFVDLRPYCNMGLADDVMDDQKGGWLDQGGNDLAYLPVGKNTFAGVPFDVIDPATNGGKAAVMLFGRDRAYFPRQTDWIPVDKQFQVLYMLHGVGWSRPEVLHYLTMIVRYRDNSTVEIPLRIAREANDWHQIEDAPNGPLAWVGKNSQVDRVGLHLFAWENPRPREFVAAVRFRSEGQAPVPGILAVTLASQKLAAGSPNRSLREMPISAALVGYRARMPLCRGFASAPEREITVHRTLPAEAKNLASLEFFIRLGKIKRAGTVAVSVAGKTFEQKIKPADCVVRFLLKQPDELNSIKSHLSDFSIQVKLSEGLHLGEFRFDTSPNVRWAPGGQDRPNRLYGVTLEATFHTTNPSLARWGHLELPYPGRQAPVPVVEQAAAKAAAAFEAGPRASVCLNGEWQLASAPPAKIPAAFPAAVHVPGVWYLAKGLKDEDSKTHSLWYRTTFLVPSTFPRSGKIVLGFGKVSYHATVFVNGKRVGTHTGDLDPFDCDVTGIVRVDGVNDLVVCVEDQTNYFVPIHKRLKLNLADVRGQEGYAYVWTLPSCGKTDNEGWNSTLAVYENGKKLGPGHTQHQTIRDQGKGRFSHWGGRPETLYLSTSDNTDPRKNGRTYEITYDVMVPDRMTNRLAANYGADMASWAGILGDVSLRAIPRRAIADVFVTTSVRKRSITVKTELADPAAGERVVHEVWKDGKKIMDVAEGATPWPDAHLWDISDPYMYFLRSDLYDADGKLLDRVFTPFGFRELWNEGTSFILNGRKIHLQGDSPTIAPYNTPVENRLYERTRMELWRYLNVNLLRLHLSGMNCPTFPETADEMGMLITLEAPFIPWEWVYDDEKDRPIPAHFQIVKEQYRQWARRFRNHPSFVIYSLANEFWCQPNDNKQAVATLTRQMGMLKELNDVVRKEDPSRYTELHGSEAYRQHGVPWTRITNLHYQWMDHQTRNWKAEMKNRPLIQGEIAFEGTWSFFSSNLRAKKKDGPAAAADFYWDKINAVGKYITAFMDLYRARDMSGIMPYEILQWAVNLDDPRGCENNLVTLSWPALSGPGQKPRQATVEGSIKHMNWSDPRLAAAPQNPLTDTVADHFEPQPLPPFATRPEIIVQVRKGGRWIANVPVVLYPHANQATEPVGAVTDAEGKAWLVVPEGGEYTAVVTVEGRSMAAQVTPEPMKEFSAVKTVIVSVDAAR